MDLGPAGPNRQMSVGANETRCSQVVGVVEDAVHSEIGVDRPVQYYVPAVQLQLPPFAPRLIVVRAQRRSAQVETALRRAMVAADPRIRFAAVSPMEDRLATQTRSRKLGATMFSIFGALALIVAALGLYSVLAFDVAQRTGEIGLRAALGATRHRLIGMVVGRAVQVSVAGAVIGVVAALLLAGRVQPLLFKVNARDPFIYGAVAAVLGVVAAIAGLLPGWRAARIDPSTALRN